MSVKKQTTKDWISPKQELRTMQALRFGKMSSTTLNRIFGLWVVLFMSLLLLVRLSKQRICKGCLEKL